MLSISQQHDRFGRFGRSVKSTKTGRQNVARIITVQIHYYGRGVCVCATKSGAMPLKPTKIHIIVRCDSTTLLVSVTFIPAVCEAIPKGHFH